MPDTREIAKALIRAFNVNNRFSDTIETNFVLQTQNNKDYVVVSFDEGMSNHQCSRYLDSIKRRVIHEFYTIEDDSDKEILDTARLIFDVGSFPFDMSKGKWIGDRQHGFKFMTPVDPGVVFNLKSHLAFSLKKDVQEDMSIYITTKPFNGEKYLWCGEFSNAKLRKQFEEEFLSRLRKRYENVPKGLLKVKGNDMYIRNAFDDARFINSITRHTAWLIGRSFQSSSRSDVKAFKDLMIEFIILSTKLTVTGFTCAPSLNGAGASILIPVVQDGKGARLLKYEEAFKINCAFDNSVFCNIYDKTRAELSVNGSNWIYGMNFYDADVSCYVITKIIESSVINKDHKLTISPELYFRALSPVQSPSECKRVSPSSSLESLDGSKPPEPLHQVGPGPSSKCK